MNKHPSPSSRLTVPGQRPWRQICKAGIGAATAIAVPAVTFASLFYWTGDHDANWNTTGGLAGTNWSSSPDFNNGTAGAPGSGDTAVFVLFGAGNLNTSLGRDFSINSLTFTSDAVAAHPVAIGGTNTLTLGAGGVTNNSNAPITLSTNISLGSAQTWTNNSIAQPLLVTGAISSAATTALTLSGAGAYNFQGANTYSGSTTVFTGALTLSGASGSIQNSNTGGITLQAGTSLTLDNSGANNADRLNDATTITTKGGSFKLIGNAAGSSETVGTLAIGSGSSVVSITGTASTLTFGSASIPSFSRSAGGTIDFQPNGNTIAAPNVTLQNTTIPANAIIGGYAVIGKLDNTDNTLGWATVSAGNVVPLAAYQTLTTAPAATDNAMAASGQIILTAGNKTVNSLYLTGSGGVYFTNTGDTLTIGSGGIISNGATGTGGYSTNNAPKKSTTNMAFIGTTNGDGTTSAAGPPDFGNITSSTSELTVFTASSLRIASIITGNIGLTKTGNGTLDLSDGNTQGTKPTNTFTGKVTINGGLLIINSEAQLGTPTGMASGLIPDAITFNGGVLLTYAGTTFNANRGITVGTLGGIISYTGGSNTVVDEPITGPGSFTLWSDSFNAVDPTTGTQTLHFALPTSGGVPRSNYQGATNLWMTRGDNLGGTAGAAGNMIFDAVDNQFPALSPVNANLVDGTIVNGVFTNLGVVVANNASEGVNLNNTTQTFGSLAGNLNFTNHTKTLTLGGNNLSTVYSGVISGATTTSVALIKIGIGTQTFSGSNTYTGPTQINGGALLIGSGTATTSAVTLASSLVTVGDGASNVGALGGNGTIGGAVTVTSTGHLAPAMSPTTFNTLTIANNLTINSGTLDFNFGAAPVIAQGNIGAGDLVMLSGSGSSLTLSGNITVNITPVVNGPGGFGIGAYKLLDDSTTGGTFNNTATFKINGSTNFNYNIVASGSQLDPTVGGGTVPTGDLYLQVLAGNPAFTWVGNVSGAWDTTTANWTSSSAGNVYSNGSNITFDDTATGTTNLTVQAGGVTPTLINFANGGLNYTFAGGAITVSPSSTGITKNQIGDVLFNNAVTTPIVNITGGSITVGTTGNLHSTGGINATNGALNVNGTLNTPTVTANSGGSINVGSAGTINSDIVLNLNNGGTASFSNPSQSVAAINSTGAPGSVVLNGTALNINGTTAATVGAAISGTGSLVKNTVGTLTLTNANTYSGGTTISKGILFAGNTTGSGTGTGFVQVLSGGTLDGTGPIAGPVTVSSGGVVQGTGTYSGLLTLNGTLAPGGAGILGTINLGSVTVNASGILLYDLGPTAGSDTVTANGAVSLAGNSTINLDLLSSVTAGDYPLISAASPITIVGATNFTVLHSGPGDATGLHYLVHLSSNQQQLLFTVSADPITWTGSTSGSWNFTDANWSTPTYKDASQVKFDDNGFLNPVITVEVPVAPVGGMDFENTASGPTYTILTDPVNGNVIGGGGGLTINGGGTVSMGSGNTFTGKTAINSGTLLIQDDSSLGTPPATATPGFLTIGAGSTLEANNVSGFTLSANRGITLGTTAGNPATIDVEGVLSTFVSYGGTIANAAGQTAILTKTGGGTLDLGAANTFSGGLVINGGGVRLRDVASAGTGPITVNGGGVLSVGAAIPNAIILNDQSTLGVIAAAQTLPATASVTVNGNETLDTFDPALNTTPFDLIFLGAVHGAGNINPQTTNGNNPDGGAALRFRGPGSDYSGTITLPNSEKFEIMTTVAGATASSPLGTGKFVMTGGTIDAVTNAGNFSLLNLRNSSTGSANFGNSVSVTGTGTVAINLLTGIQNGLGGTAPAGSTVSMGNLTIGDQQTVAVISNNGLSNTLSFTAVTLAGGTSTLVPSPVGNTAYPTAENLSVGTMTETAPANVVLNGAATTTFRAANNYSGSTSLLSGTLVLGAAGALPSTTALTVSSSGTNTAPTTLDFNNGGTSNDQTVASLAGTLNGVGTATATITDSDAAHTRTLTVAQSGVNTSFAGNITGNLNLTKSGNGTLVLSGANSFTGALGVSGGTLQFTGTNSFAGATTVSNGATLSVGSDVSHGTLVSAINVASGSLTGAGTTGPVTVQAGARLAPGNIGDNIAGVMTINGVLDLSANSGGTNQAHLSLDLGDPNNAAVPTGSDQIRVNTGAIKLGGDLQLALFSPASHTPAINDVFYIIINSGGSAVNGLFSNAPVTDNINDSTGTFTDAAGDTFAISYTANAGNASNGTTNGFAGFTPGQGKDIAVEVLSVIPEPGSLATILSGFGVLLGLQRFRRRG